MEYRISPSSPMGVAHLNIVFAMKETASYRIVSLMEVYSALKRVLVYGQKIVNQKKDAVPVL